MTTNHLYFHCLSIHSVLHPTFNCNRQCGNQPRNLAVPKIECNQYVAIGCAFTSGRLSCNRYVAIGCKVFTREVFLCRYMAIGWKVLTYGKCSCERYMWWLVVKSWHMGGVLCVASTVLCGNAAVLYERERLLQPIIIISLYVRLCGL